MNNELSDITGSTLGSSMGWSPANFDDSDSNRPTAAEFDLLGNGSTTPYTGAVNGLLQKHLDEIKQKITIPSGWKKRLREFLSRKNTELLDFLNLPVNTHGYLGKGDTILRKFGNIHYNPNHASIREFVLDTSGCDVAAEISAQLLSIRNDDGLKDYTDSVRFIFEEYIAAGDEALKCESLLKSKLDVLDKIQVKLADVIDLEKTDGYIPLMESMEAYLGTVFDSQKIDDVYIKFIAAYRRFIALRDIVLMTRTIDIHESEPMCTICYNEPVSYCISPCGHTFCTVCSRKQSAACFLCRGVIRDKIKVYFG